MSFSQIASNFNSCQAAIKSPQRHKFLNASDFAPGPWENHHLLWVNNQNKSLLLTLVINTV